MVSAMSAKKGQGELRRQGPAAVGDQHHYVALREVQDARRFEDDGEGDGDQAEDRADHQTRGDEV